MKQESLPSAATPMQSPHSPHPIKPTPLVARPMKALTEPSSVLAHLATSAQKSRSKSTPKIPTPIISNTAFARTSSASPSVSRAFRGPTSNIRPPPGVSNHSNSFSLAPPKLNKTVSTPELGRAPNTSVTTPLKMPLPPITRTPTFQQQGFVFQDWRSHVAIEERMSVRKKLCDAYRKNCRSYEELLNIVASVDEELLYCSASTRLDYFKGSIDWDNKLQIKKKLLEGVKQESHVSLKRNVPSISSQYPENGNSSPKSPKKHKH